MDLYDQFTNDPPPPGVESVVRCALALRLGELATIAKRFLETAQWVRTLSITEQASSASAGSRKPSNTGAGDAGGSNSSALSGAAGATSTGVGGVVNGGAGLVVGATISCDSGSKAAGAPTVACGQHDGLDAVAASTLRSFDTELATLQEQVKSRHAARLCPKMCSGYAGASCFASRNCGCAESPAYPSPLHRSRTSRWPSSPTLTPLPLSSGPFFLA